MLFPVHVSVRTDDGLQPQTVVKTVWLLSGTHSQRKIVSVTCSINLIKSMKEA